jgi:CheY-like chemotaxis protein
MKNILVVDDNKCIRDLLVMVVNAFLKDCSVHLAENGSAAAAIFDATPLHAIVTDLSMPVMDGFQFIQYVRRRSSDMPIIAMTADPGPYVVQRLKVFGVERCLEKPFDVRYAAQQIASALESSARHPFSRVIENNFQILIQH